MNHRLPNFTDDAAPRTSCIREIREIRGQKKSRPLDAIRSEGSREGRKGRQEKWAVGGWGNGGEDRRPTIACRRPNIFFWVQRLAAARPAKEEDAPRFARQIEGAYRAMWREWCAKEEGK
jgi:hypothetical protein